MRYKLCGISLFILLFVFAQESMAQDAARRTRPRPSAVADTSAVFNLTERAQIKNEVESKKPSHIVWERLIYRIVDLTKEGANAALYYPVQPQNGRQNLFTLLFKLLLDNKITAYNYLDWEVFDDSQKKNVEDLLKKLQLSYTRQGDRFIVDERDIPGSEVTQYMMKEGYFFDQATGMFQTNVLALSPIQVSTDYYSGGLSREPLFWVKYDDIRPYLSREMIMTSNYNNALTYTIDDYFRKTMYSGEIVKTVNMMGKSLAQEVGGDSTALKNAQDSIEAQLKAFDAKLWVYNDSVRTNKEKVQDKKVEKTKTTSVRASGATKEKVKKEQKPSKSQPAPKSESAPVRSVRRTR